MSKKVVVIGSNHAGTACVNALLGAQDKPEVVVFDKNSNISFLGCGMALWIGNQISTGDGLFYASKELLEEKGAKVNMECEVVGVDYDKKLIRYKDKDGKEAEESYDKLVIATGSSPIVPNFPGKDLKNIQLAKRYQDAEEAVRKTKDESIKNVIVVGAGYIGVELAEAFERHGKNVTLIDSADRILSTHFDRDYSDMMEDKLKEHGIKLELGQLVTEFKGTDKVEKVVTDKGEYDADMVVLCIGFRPNNQLGEGKLDLFKNGAILVNKKQETSVKDVYAIGDCATVYDNSLDAVNYIALATNAVRSGIVAANNALGNEIESLGVQGSSALCIYGLKMVATGLSKTAAERHGVEILSTEFVAQQKPAFMDEVGPNPEVKIRINYRKSDRVVVGAQMISEYDMSGTIHMFSLAIQEKVTIDKIALLDIFFMPHFNEPYNYITMAAISAE